MPGLGLIGSLYMGAQSLVNNSIATEVIGNNLSNANTPGASRQQAVLTNNIPLSLGVGYQSTGSVVSGIQSDRSSFLDSQVVNQLNLQGFYNQQATLSQLAESALGENLTSGSTSASSGASGTLQTGLQNSLDSFFSAFNDLAANPTSTAVRQEVVDSAQALSQNLNDIYGNVLSTQSGIAQDASSVTDQINQLATTIASLNQQIISEQAGTGQPADTLIDQREQDIESLSSLVNISTTDNANGSVNISLADAPTVVLVNGVNGGGAGGTESLSATYSTSSVPPLQVSGSISGPLGTDVPTSGQLGADLAVANDLIGSGAAAGDSGMLGQLDDLANNLVSVVNTQNSAGYDLNGNPGGDFFSSSTTGAGNISVDSSIVADPSTIAAADNSGPLSGANATLIANLQNNANIAPAQLALTEFVGNYTQQANENESNQQLITSQVEQQRDSVSGISVDEEVTNLITYQRSYEASAEFINTISQMLQTLVSTGSGSSSG